MKNYIVLFVVALTPICSAVAQIVDNVPQNMPVACNKQAVCEGRLYSAPSNFDVHTAKIRRSGDVLSITSPMTVNGPITYTPFDAEAEQAIAPADVRRVCFYTSNVTISKGGNNKVKKKVKRIGCANVRSG